MVNTSKILTVSYGTFSCTLEGFDDSFDMMKAIAEYFRDLAADDRYFGAEPPTPDAEMLTRIAEREVSRRVEARQERGAIVLRPSDTPTSAPAAESVAAATPAPVAKAPETPVEQPAPKAAPVTAPRQLDEESVAEKLSRIRAVVSRNGETEQSTPAYSEDEHAEDFSGKAAASIAAALRDEDEFEEVDFDQADTFEMDSDADILDQDDLDDIAEDIAEEAHDPLVADPQLAEDMAETASEPAVEPTPPARVIRMKRADFEAAVAEGQLTEEVDEDDNTSALSAEDEAELLKELAAVEAELALDDDADAAPEDDLRSIFSSDEEDEPEAQVEVTPPKAPAGQVAAEATTDVGRLMEKARTEMDRPDGAHRRSAIAHLRAAVEATRAETEAGGGLKRDDGSLNTYREDLNSVVRPRRPRPATPADQPAEAPRRPSTKPAPLKLVAEQRVDTGKPQPQAVRPRRVLLTELEEEVEQTPADQDEASSFAEFAEQVGVKDLSDLMEAAAAYISYVEGRQKFSRPQLMNKARQVEEYQFSREDGLRSFGHLLRQGKIEKLKGGRFTVADDLIGFKPDKRAVG